MEKTQTGRVIWITGLSGAGKTTLARELQSKLPGSILLDGDALRAALGTANCAFDSQGRQSLALTYGRLAALLALQGFTVIVATISLFHAQHAWNRENLPNYLEVFLDIPEAVRRARDPKGLYAGEKKGQIANMAGVSLAAELPLAPHLRFDESSSCEKCIKEIMAIIKT